MPSIYDHVETACKTGLEGAAQTVYVMQITPPGEHAQVMSVRYVYMDETDSVETTWKRGLRSDIIIAIDADGDLFEIFYEEQSSERNRTSFNIKNGEASWGRRITEKQAQKLLSAFSDKFVLIVRPTPQLVEVAS